MDESSFFWEMRGFSQCFAKTSYLPTIYKGDNTFLQNADFSSNFPKKLQKLISSKIPEK
jgi:hypothetical protein